MPSASYNAGKTAQRLRKGSNSTGVRPLFPYSEVRVWTGAPYAIHRERRVIAIPRDDEFTAKEQRVRDILRRLKACHRVTASPRSLNPASPRRGHYSRGAGEDSPRQDWMADVANALRRGAGATGTRVLIARAARQDKSQANAFRTIAMQLGMAESDAVGIYCMALVAFLFWMDRLGVPDDYRPEAVLPVVMIRSANRNNPALDAPCGTY